MTDMISSSPDGREPQIQDYYNLNTQMLDLSFKASMGPSVFTDANVEVDVLKTYFNPMVVLLAQLQDIASSEGLHYISGQAVLRLSQIYGKEAEKYATTLAKLDEIKQSFIAKENSPEDWLDYASKTISDMLKDPRSNPLICIKTMILPLLNPESKAKLTQISFT